jgi:hypothetical protein
VKNKKRVKTIRTSFSGGNLTNYSGIYPMFKFMKKMKLNHLFEQKISLADKSNQKYSLNQILYAVILGTLSGMNRLIKIENFTLDPLVRHLLSIEDKLDIDTIRYHINKFGMKQNTELSDIFGILSAKVHKKLGTTEDIVDLDSSVKTVYGKQEGARKGFNSKNKGKRSYHPQFAFLNSTKECLLAWLRPGDTHSANNADEFIKQALSMIPKGISSLLVRADRGYFDGKLISVIESYPNVRYLIKVRMRNLNDLLRRQDWDKIPSMPGWEMTEFYYQAKSWDRPRRFVAVRKFKGMLEVDSLFPVRDYSYFCYVTNIEESPLYLHRLYGDRGESENWIEAVKNQLYAATILTNGFWANEALFLLSVLAYNISVWMRALTDKKAWRQEPLSFRLWFIQLAGKLTNSGRVRYLKMYSSYYYKSWWSEIDERIDAITFA